MLSLCAAGLAVLVVVAILTRAPGDAAIPQPSATQSWGVDVPTSTPAASVPLGDASANADAFIVADFARPGVFFVSTSLNLRCGILVDEGYPGEGLGRWGCFVMNYTWEFASAAAGDPCFDPPAPMCGGGIEASGHELPGPMLRGTIDDSYASRWIEQDGDEGYPVRTLAAGESLTYAGITCSAAENNVVTCTDSVTAHGFTISGTSYLIF